MGEVGGDGGDMTAYCCKAERGFAFVVCRFDGDTFVQGLFNSRNVPLAGCLEECCAGAGVLEAFGERFGITLSAFGSDAVRFVGENTL